MTIIKKACLLRSASRALLFALCLIVGVALMGATALAQPLPRAFFKQNQTPPDVPSFALIGDTITFKVRFENTGTVGFNPFIDLAFDFGGANKNALYGITQEPCDGIEFVSAQMVDISGGPIALLATVYGNTNAASCSAPPAPHPYAGVGLMTFPPGWQMVTLALPFGSFAGQPLAQPPAVVEVKAKIHSFATAGFPLAICRRGGFRFTTAIGGNPVLEIGATNTITNSTWQCEHITPEVLGFKKEYSGPEDETAIGANFLHTYKLSLDIADQQPVGLPLTIMDCLPNSIAYEGGLVVNAPTSWGPYTATTPTIGTVNNPSASCLKVEWGPSVQVIGVSNPSPDATVEFKFSVRGSDANDNPVLKDSCTPVILPNSLSVSGKWTPLDPRDTGGTINGSNPNAHNLSAKCIAIQKAVKVFQEFPHGALGPTPGDLLQYTLTFQIADPNTIGHIRIVDQLSNGQIFQTGPAPVLTIGDQFGNYTNVPVLPAHYTATPAPAKTFKKCPATGGTQLDFDISGTLASIPPSNPRQAAGILTGGYATLPSSSVPATGTVIFYAMIGDTFSDMHLPAAYVDKDDALCNEVEIRGTVYRNEWNPNAMPYPVSSTQVARDTSDSKISIVTDILTKFVYAVRRGGGWSCGPASLNPNPPRACASGEQVFPGDQITFNIKYTIPSGSAQSLSISDWLPRPVFDVNDPDANPSTVLPWAPVPNSYLPPCPAAAPPAPGNACRLPTQTLPATAVPSFTFTQIAGTNSLTFDYGTFHNTANTAWTIDQLFTATVTSSPMADALFLSNEAQECEQDSFGTTFCQTAITQIQVREPKLNISKGAIATDSPSGLFTQPTSPASTLAQAPAGATFSLAGFYGLVTSSPGPNAIGSLFHSNLFNVDASDLATFAIVIENQGGYPAYNVHISDFIPWDKTTGQATCFEIIFSTLSIKNGAGATVSAPAGFSGANLGVLFTSPIPALDASTASGGSNSGANIIVITFQVRLLPNTRLTAGCCDNDVNLTQYMSSADPNSPDFVTAGVGGPFNSAASICVGPSAAAKCIQETSEPHTAPQQAAQGGQVPAAIGEIVQFRLVIIIPEGTTKNLQIQDALPVGLTYIPGTARAVFVANNAVTNSLGIPTHDPLPRGGAPCPGGPTPVTPIKESPSSFITGAGTDPNFPSAPIDIINTDNDPDLEYLVIEFNAQVDNITSNHDGTVLSNAFQAQFTDALTGHTVASPLSQVVSVGIVEPKLSLTKTANPTAIGSTGAVIAYTVIITNTPGTATAFDVVFTDTLPNGFSNGSFTALSLGCTSSVTGNGQILGVACPNLPVNGAVTIKYQATATPQACPTTMTNQAAVTWTSLPGTNGTLSNPTGSATAGLSGADNGERNGVTPPVVPLNYYHAAGSVAVACVVPSRDLVVTKLYDNVPGLTYPNGVPLAFHTDCSDPANPSAPHITADATILTSHVNNQFPIANAPVGWTCMVTETVPIGTDLTGCHWGPGIAVTPNPTTIQLSTLSSVSFENNYICPINFTTSGSPK